MHVVSHGGSSGGAGPGGGGGKGGSNPRFSKTSSVKGSSSGKSGSKGGQGLNLLSNTSVTKTKSAGGATIYKIGKQKFTLDGRDGKTLDDVIEVKIS